MNANSSEPAGIVPIVSYSSRKRKVSRLLGTGFFIGRTVPFVVTARHVANGRSVDFASGESIGFWYQHPDSVHYHPIAMCFPSPNLDIAAFAVTNLNPSRRFRMSKNLVPTTIDVLTLEFGTSEINEEPTYMRGVTHKGNAMVHDSYDPVIRAAVFQLSFPALQGASGAPIVRATDFVVVGMLVANRERELMPAQIVRVEGDGIVEETRYFLPSGIALEGASIIEFLESINAKPELVD
jgi:Trypsin-like peptidase domain